MDMTASDATADRVNMPDMTTSDATVDRVNVEDMTTADTGHPLNSCVQSNGGCGENAQCTNQDGEVFCVCLPGFLYNPDGVCVPTPSGLSAAGHIVIAMAARALVMRAMKQTVMTTV